MNQVITNRGVSSICARARAHVIGANDKSPYEPSMSQPSAPMSIPAHAPVSTTAHKATNDRNSAVNSANNTNEATFNHDNQGTTNEPASNQTTQGAGTASDKLANDVLGCVYRFILEHVYNRCDDSLPALKPDQVLRGWQHMATAPLGDEWCVITIISQTRQSMPIHDYLPEANSDMGKLSINHLLHHNVQIDFFCNPKHAGDNRAYERAFIVAALASSSECAAIFHGYNPAMSCLYSDEVLNFSELDEAHQMRHRFSITLHLSEIKSHDRPQRFIDGLKLMAKNISNNED